MHLLEFVVVALVIIGLVLALLISLALMFEGVKRIIGHVLEWLEPKAQWLGKLVADIRTTYGNVVDPKCQTIFDEVNGVTDLRIKAPSGVPIDDKMQTSLETYIRSQHRKPFRRRIRLEYRNEQWQPRKH